MPKRHIGKHHEADHCDEEHHDKPNRVLGRLPERLIEHLDAGILTQELQRANEYHQGVDGGELSIDQGLYFQLRNVAQQRGVAGVRLQIRFPHHPDNVKYGTCNRYYEGCQVDGIENIQREVIPDDAQWVAFVFIPLSPSHLILQVFHHVHNESECQRHVNQAWHYLQSQVKVDVSPLLDVDECEGGDVERGLNQATGQGSKGGVHN
mmetsp:Transcript_28647/g.66418  ORF Transcript_28647/g.66418 Transcript_28647/m.66418 type:complete len:207 (+) Transcript_28647:1285-1905(+)